MRQAIRTQQTGTITSKQRTQRVGVQPKEQLRGHPIFQMVVELQEEQDPGPHG